MIRVQGLKSSHSVLGFLIILIFSLLPQISFSLGFGEIRVHSRVSEPLDFSIELTNVDNIDTDQVVVSLVSAEDFRKSDAVVRSEFPKLTCKIAEQKKRSFLQITSEEPLKERYLDFLVVMTWPEGRLIRKYALLLDPASSYPSARAFKPETKSDLKALFEPDSESLALEEEAEAENKAIASLPKKDIPSKRVYENKLLLWSSLGLLFVVVLTIWIFKLAREILQVIPREARSLKDTLAFDEEINIRFNLVDHYLAIEEYQNAREILNEILLRGKTREIALAKIMLEKIPS